MSQFAETFFGKPLRDAEKGDFVDYIDGNSKYEFLTESIFYKCLIGIKALKSKFENSFFDSQKGTYSTVALLKFMKLANTDKVVLLTSKVKANYLGLSNPVHLSELDGFEQFWLSAKEKQKSDLGLCYATNELVDDVSQFKEISSQSYSINKMFVTTYRNYAGGFNAQSFKSNYQVSNNIQKLLEAGGQYVLKNHVLKIADVGHFVLPQVFSQSNVNFQELLTKIYKRSELLFLEKQVKEFIDQIEDSDSIIYWIDFIGFYTDGNSFKTINYIKDVSKTHFDRLLKTFQKVNREFNQVEGIEWQNVMSRGKDSLPLSLNFQTLYLITPLRKDKEKKNEALVLFKAILEQRKVDAQKLFEHYVELLLCHRYHRYKSYNNIYEPETINDKTVHFDYAIRNATYQYLAIFQVLKRLNLLKNMEEANINSISTEEQEPTSYQQKTEAFFETMGYTEPQKAMFYLGRALSGIASAQVKAKHANKPILEKVNYNGMDIKSILKLYADLREKVKQYVKYDTLKFVEPPLSNFDERFQPTNWKMAPDEALFFLFSGYSFRVPTDKKTDNN